MKPEYLNKNVYSRSVIDDIICISIYIYDLLMMLNTKNININHSWECRCNIPFSPSAESRILRSYDNNSTQNFFVKNICCFSGGRQYM
jgi:hypothetical protein